MALSFTVATDADVAALAALRTAAADQLTREHGKGPWSSATTEGQVARAMRHARMLVARSEDGIVGTVRLAEKKPWAIDPTYFQAVTRPLYLTDMAVDPAHQRRGVGRRMMEAARTEAHAWPADAIRLDAYDAAAGAGPFYAKCGLTEVGRVTYRRTPLIYFEWLL